jgi:RHS repeat-associated protein
VKFQKTGNGDDVTLDTRLYNGLNQLVRVMRDGDETYFNYRPDGLRHSKQGKNPFLKIYTHTTHCWDGQNMVLETNANGEVKARYLRGINLIAQAVGEALYFYLFNAHGDVIQQVAGTGERRPKYVYDAFGNQQNPNKTDPNPFRYCGEYFDSETQEIYLRARYYNPETGRFGSEDPIKHRLNWYVYCGNDPIEYVDPSGLSFWSSLWDTAKNTVNKVVGAAKNARPAHIKLPPPDVVDGGFAGGGSGGGGGGILEFSAEEAVLDGGMFSFYKGVPVIKLPRDRSFSIGIIVFGSPRSRSEDIDTIKHEWGHTRQLKNMGLLRYLLGIAIPSSTSPVRNSVYYSQPWEVTADLYGGVYRGTSAEDIAIGKSYDDFVQNAPIHKVAGNTLLTLLSFFLHSRSSSKSVYIPYSSYFSSPTDFSSKEVPNPSFRAPTSSFSSPSSSPPPTSSVIPKPRSKTGGGGGGGGVGYLMTR